MSIALARKYRPSSFEDLIGQDTVSQTLSMALDTDKISHAYLFSGLRGSGKTSTARIFAKALLCERGASSHPCNQCSDCIMANESRHMDIIEMDAASNRGIDDIKDLIEHTKYKPSSARYKVFIIDEIHMLTTQAFNALLKTLEEPPAFVKFILATTDPLKLPATILSRVQHFRFKKISQKLVKKHLEHILNMESVEFDSEAVDIIARSGAGSLRDSITLLDQAIVYCKNYLNLNTVVNMLGIIDPSVVESLLNNIYNKEEDKVLEFITDNKEYEAEMIMDEITLYLKDLLLSSDKRFTPMIIDRFFRAISQSKRLFEIGGDGEFILALTLFKMMESLNIKDIDSMIKSLEKELHGVTVTPTNDSSKVTARAKAPVLSVEEDLVKDTITQNIVKKEEPKSIDISDIKFKQLVDKIYDRNYELGDCFNKNISFDSFVDNTLTWNSTAIDDDKKMLISHWNIIKTFTQDIFGIDTKIKSNAKKKVLTKEEVGSEAKAITSDISNDYFDDCQTKSSCVAPPSGNTYSAKEKDSSEILEEPMIKEVLKLFDPIKVKVKRNV